MRRQGEPQTKVHARQKLKQVEMQAALQFKSAERLMSQKTLN